MVLVCLPSDVLLQHLLSYLDFSYLGRWVSLHGCSSKAQLLLLTLDEGCLLTTTLPDLQRGIAPLGPLEPVQPPLCGLGVAPPGCRPWLWARGSFSQPFLRSRSLALSATAPDLGRGVTPLDCCPSGMGSSPILPRPRTWGSSSRPCLVHQSQLPALICNHYFSNIITSHISLMKISVKRLVSLFKKFTR